MPDRTDRGRRNGAANTTPAEQPHSQRKQHHDRQPPDPAAGAATPSPQFPLTRLAPAASASKGGSPTVIPAYPPAPPIPPRQSQDDIRRPDSESNRVDPNRDRSYSNPHSRTDASDDRDDYHSPNEGRYRSGRRLDESNVPNVSE